MSSDYVGTDWFRSQPMKAKHTLMPAARPLEDTPKHIIPMDREGNVAARHVLGSADQYMATAEIKTPKKTLFKQTTGTSLASKMFRSPSFLVQHAIKPGASERSGSSSLGSKKVTTSAKNRTNYSKEKQIIAKQFLETYFKNGNFEKEVHFDEVNRRIDEGRKEKISSLQTLTLGEKNSETRFERTLTRYNQHS